MKRSRSHNNVSYREDTHVATHEAIPDLSDKATSTTAEYDWCTLIPGLVHDVVQYGILRFSISRVCNFIASDLIGYSLHGI
jgi:hypothetical protein